MSFSLSRSFPARYPIRSVACGATTAFQPSLRTFSCARGRSSAFCSGPAGATSATRAPDSSGFARRKCFAGTKSYLWRELRSESDASMFQIWHMRCFCRCASNKQLRRVAEWLVRKRSLVRRAVADQEVADPAVAVPAVEVAAWAAVVLPAAKAEVAAVAQAAVVGTAVAAVDVPAVVEAGAHEVVDKAAAVVAPVVAADRAAAVVVDLAEVVWD